MYQKMTLLNNKGEITPAGKSYIALVKSYANLYYPHNEDIKNMYFKLVYEHMKEYLNHGVVKELNCDYAYLLRKYIDALRLKTKVFYR